MSWVRIALLSPLIILGVSASMSSHAAASPASSSVMSFFDGTNLSCQDTGTSSAGCARSSAGGSYSGLVSGIPSPHVSAVIDRLAGYDGIGNVTVSILYSFLVTSPVGNNADVPLSYLGSYQGIYGNGSGFTGRVQLDGRQIDSFCTALSGFPGPQSGPFGCLQQAGPSGAANGTYSYSVIDLTISASPNVEHTFRLALEVGATSGASVSAEIDPTIGFDTSAGFDPSGYSLRLSDGIGNSAANPTSVPEPTSIAIFGLGLLGLAAARRRKSR